MWGSPHRGSTRSPLKIGAERDVIAERETGRKMFFFVLFFLEIEEGRKRNFDLKQCKMRQYLSVPTVSSLLLNWRRYQCSVVIENTTLINKMRCQKLEKRHPISFTSMWSSHLSSWRTRHWLMFLLENSLEQLINTQSGHTSMVFQLLYGLCVVL